MFSFTGDRPFDPSNALRRAHQFWEKADLDPLGFHEARHTYASLMIAAGADAKALASYMGHQRPRSPAWRPRLGLATNCNHSATRQRVTGRLEPTRDTRLDLQDPCKQGNRRD